LPFGPHSTRDCRACITLVLSVQAGLKVGSAPFSLYSDEKQPPRMLDFVPYDFSIIMLGSEVGSWPPTPQVQGERAILCSLAERQSNAPTNARVPFRKPCHRIASRRASGRAGSWSARHG